MCRARWCTRSWPDEMNPPMRMTRWLALILGLVGAAPLRAQDDFARDVYPILRKACFDCHGPDKQRGKLRLDARAAALRVIVPGKAEASELYRRILLPADTEGAMPSRGERLTA